MFLFDLLPDLVDEADSDAMTPEAGAADADEDETSTNAFEDEADASGCAAAATADLGRKSAAVAGTGFLRGAC